VEFEVKGAEVPEDVEIVLARLKSGLEELLGAFQLYLREVGLSDADLSAAQEAVRPKQRSRQPKSTSAPQQALADKPQQTEQRPSLGNQRTSSSTSIKGAQGNPPRRRLEQRDRGKDLEFLNAPKPSARQTEKQRQTSAEREEESEQETGQTADEEGSLGQRRNVRREMEQVR